VIICHCRVVTDADVREAVDAGAHTVAAVCRSTGAGTDCGSCVFTVKALLCEDDVAAVRTMDDLRTSVRAEETLRATG